jgi:hypothetical protein
LVDDARTSRAEIICKPWPIPAGKPNLFKKTDFKLDLRSLTITCPAGQTESFEPGQVVEFDPDVCGNCSLRAQCTHSTNGKGRSVSIAKDELLQKRLRVLQSSETGRSELRQRTGVEHRLAHVAARQGRRARYIGTRKNVFDLRRAAAVQNLETIHRRKVAA